MQRLDILTLLKLEISSFRKVEISSFRRVEFSKQTSAKADDSNFIGRHKNKDIPLVSCSISKSSSRICLYVLIETAVLSTYAAQEHGYIWPL